MACELINRRLIDKQDLARFIQAFVNYLPDVTADQRGYTPALRNVVGFVYIPGICYTYKIAVFLILVILVLLRSFVSACITDVIQYASVHAQ